MDTVLDLQRQTHEEIERFERALATVLSKPQPNHQVRLANEHKAAQILERISSRAVALNALYDDEQARSAEIALLSAPQSNDNGSQDELAEFYSRLVKITEHHHKYPDSVVGGFDLELSALADEPLADGEDDFEEEDPISLLFSGEEAYGRYLDLYANHTMYNNLRHLPKRLSYLQYLDLLLAAQNGPVHHDLPQETRMTKEYEAYLTNLHSYLLSFTKRTQPLTDIPRIHQDAESEFDDLWGNGKLDGWNPVKREKSEDTAGIWCTACQKQYSKQTVYDAHLKSKKHTKAVERQTAGSAAASPANNPNGTTMAPTDNINGHVNDVRSKYRAAAKLTHLITTLLRPLSTVLADTKSNVERRFSLTARERELELEEAVKPLSAPATNGNQSAVQEDEEEEEKIYNPLKLPLGWDGKPIPYWLYKLHGLGVEYRCEICSDHVYMGRKNFDRHFQESRHAFGMRALGLPNTKHFHEITRIEDALSLAEKLKQEGRQEIFQQETMEELEDDEGNVYNKKTYDDLKKQGLI